MKIDQCGVVTYVLFRVTVTLLMNVGTFEGYELTSSSSSSTRTSDRKSEVIILKR